MKKSFVKFYQLYQRARAKHHKQKTIWSARLPGRKTPLYKHLKKAFDMAVEHDIPLEDWIAGQIKIVEFHGHFPYPNQFATDAALDRALEVRNLRRAKKSNGPLKLLKVGYNQRISAYRDNGVWWAFRKKDFDEDENWTGTDENKIKNVVYRLDKLKFHGVNKPALKKKLKKRLKKLFAEGQRF